MGAGPREAGRWANPDEPLLGAGLQRASHPIRRRPPVPLHPLHATPADGWSRDGDVFRERGCSSLSLKWYQKPLLCRQFDEQQRLEADGSTASNKNMKGSKIMRIAKKSSSSSRSTENQNQA